MAGSMVYRLRVGAPNNPHMQRFRRAMAKIQAIRDKRGYNHIAGFHGEPNWYCWHHQRNQKNPRVRARLLLPWHRAYLWWLEQALQDAMKEEADGVALPWWDWTTQRGVPEAYAAETVGGVEHANPGIRMVLREVSSIDGRLALRVRLKSHRPWKLLVVPKHRPPGRDQKMRHLLGVDVLDRRQIGGRTQDTIEQQHFVALDQSADLLHRLGRTIAVVVGDVVDLAAIYSTLIVDHLEVSCLCSTQDGEGGVRSAVRHRVANPDRGIARA